jgi:hypothetical protein
MFRLSIRWWHASDRLDDEVGMAHQKNSATQAGFGYLKTPWNGATPASIMSGAAAGESELSRVLHPPNPR